MVPGEQHGRVSGQLREPGDRVGRVRAEPVDECEQARRPAVGDHDDDRGPVGLQLCDRSLREPVRHCR
jgi:hypothetical protein